MKTKRLFILSLLFLIASIISLVIYFYSLKIHFTGKIIFAPISSIEKLEYMTPLNKTYNLLSEDQSFSGYFKEIVFIKSDTSVNPVFYQVFANNTVRLDYCPISINTFKLLPAELNFFQKIKAIVLYNKIQLITAFICLLILIVILIKLKGIINLIKNELIRLYKKANHAFKFITSNKKSLILAFLLSLLIYPVLFFVFDIDFSLLYNVSFIVIYPIICFVFFIPILGTLIVKKNERIRYGFFAFWLILIFQYFVISPFLFAGNYGFHDCFQNYAIASLKNGFFSSLFVNDTGYLALLPRIIYGVAKWLSPDASQVIAITSSVALIIYSFILGFFASEKARFLWPAKGIGFVFVILFALFPFFSTVPGLNFQLSITDVAYYGILFAFFLLFIISDIRISSVFFLTILNCILILSKSHMVVLFPIYTIGLIIFFVKKNNKGLFLTILSLLAIVVQVSYCYVSLKNMTGQDQAGGSFTFNTFNYGEQIIVSLTYLIKFYVFLLMPFITINGKFLFVIMTIAVVFIIALLFIALRMMWKSTHKLIAIWFIGGNILALTSAVFYAYTFPGDIIVNKETFWELIKSIDVNLSRYTIGVNAILAITVIPFILFLLTELFKKIMPQISLKISFIVMIILVLNGMIFNKAAISFPNFWSRTKNDQWSYEWKQLVPLLKNKEYYIPSLLYPNSKQVVASDNLEVSNDFVPGEQAGFFLKEEKNVHAIIVMNVSQNNEKQIPIMAETFHKGSKTGQLKPLYKSNQCLRFIYFLNTQTSLTDSIGFLNNKGKPALINSLIRVISKK